MKWRAVGFTVTIAAVLVLSGSLVAGLRLSSSGMQWEPAAANRSVAPSEQIRVEVLNGAGISGLARQVTEELRAEGFDVVYYGNAGRLARDSTTVLDRSGDLVSASKLAEALGIERVEMAVDTTLYLEATLILGPDWESIRGGP